MTPEPKRARAREILGKLREAYQTESEGFAVPRSARGERSAFEVLVVTLLSQNTNDQNTMRAYANLKEAVAVEPKAILEAEEGIIEEAIKVGGLYRTKTKALKAISSEVLKRFGGSLDDVLDLPLDEARQTLMSLPKVGPKTADILLLFLRGRETIPVDTHVSRVSRRLGLAPPGGGYEEVRQSLMGLFRPEDYLDLHLLLIAHGRGVCQARRPRCPECLLAELCLHPEI